MTALVSEPSAMYIYNMERACLNSVFINKYTTE